MSDAERLDALASAQVWRQPSVPIHRARLGASAETPQQLTCRFRLDALGGTTAKFDCDVEGEKVRIKYGAGPELPAEAAATRLLRALGFGADDVALVPRLRCFGCPAEPFVIAKVVGATGTSPLYEHALDYDDYHDFEWVALERKLDARPIETERVRGLVVPRARRIEPRRGGAPRAHVDALRLLAVFLAHWDNKSENQRLVCLEREWPEGTPCRVTVCDDSGPRRDVRSAQGGSGEMGARRDLRGPRALPDLDARTPLRRRDVQRGADRRRRPPPSRRPAVTADGASAH